MCSYTQGHHLGYCIGIVLNSAYIRIQPQQRMQEQQEKVSLRFLLALKRLLTFTSMFLMILTLCEQVYHALAIERLFILYFG
jgi:sulfite exporter TauE/SafE